MSLLQYEILDSWVWFVLHLNSLEFRYLYFYVNFFMWQIDMNQKVIRYCLTLINKRFINKVCLIIIIWSISLSNKCRILNKFILLNSWEIRSNTNWVKEKMFLRRKKFCKDSIEFLWKQYFLRKPWQSIKLRQ